MQYFIKDDLQELKTTTGFQDLATLRMYSKRKQCAVAEAIGRSSSWVCNLEQRRIPWVKLNDLCAYASACGYDTEIHFIRKDQK